jgi:ankyrin repeat protein
VIKDRDGRNELLNAIFSKNMELSISLIESGEFDLEDKDNNGFTALHAASSSLLPDIVKKLIENGADVNSIDGWGNPPIQRALGNKPENSSIIDILLASGADIHIVNGSGNSVASHVSKIKGHPNYEQLSRHL